jgi:hypothetical protein
MAHISLFSQKSALERDSLVVYTAMDMDIAALLDTFIIETKSIDYPSKEYFIYFT